VKGDDGEELIGGKPTDSGRTYYGAIVGAADDR
jgi:hypothetical protein